MDALSDPYEWYRQQLISQTTKQALNDQQAAQRRQVPNTEAQQFQLMLQQRLDQGAHTKANPSASTLTRSTTMSELPINPSLESKHEYFNQANQAKLGQALQADPDAKALFESLVAQKNPSDASIKQLIGQLKGHFEPGTSKGAENILGQNLAGAQGSKGGEQVLGQNLVGAQSGKGGEQALDQNLAGTQGSTGGQLQSSPESLLGKPTNEEGTTMDKLRPNAASSYAAPENKAQLAALLSQNPEAKALFDQLSQQQLSPQLRSLLSVLAPGQLAQLANLTPQELTNFEKGGVEKLLAKLGISPEVLNNLGSLKGADVARLGELKELIQQFSRATTTTAGQQGVPQGPIGDAILAALNTPVAQELTAENAARTASTQARVVQIGELVAERIFVTNPELSQKQEVLIVLKQEVLPGTQIKLSREGDVLNIAFQARGQETANFINQNVGQLRELLQGRLGEPVNIAVKSEQEQREENEGRSRNRRSVMDEMQDDESPA